MKENNDQYDKINKSPKRNEKCKHQLGRLTKFGKS